MMYGPTDPIGERLALNLAARGQFQAAADTLRPVVEEKEKLLSRASFLTLDLAGRYPPNFLTAG
jgi:hypothetical protein